MTKLEFMEALRAWVLVHRLRLDHVRQYVEDATLEFIDMNCQRVYGNVLGRTVGQTRNNNFSIRIWGKSILTKRGLAQVFLHEICHIIAEVRNPHIAVIHGPAFWKEILAMGMNDFDRGFYLTGDEIGELPHAWTKPDLLPFIDAQEVEGLR